MYSALQFDQTFKEHLPFLRLFHKVDKRIAYIKFLFQIWYYPTIDREKKEREGNREEKKANEKGKREGDRITDQGQRKRGKESITD